MADTLNLYRCSVRTTGAVVEWAAIAVWVYISPVHGVGVGVGVAVAVGVGVGAPDCAQYLPPVSRRPPVTCPPQTIISLPVQTAV